jgi:hypothetical protein
MTRRLITALLHAALSINLMVPFDNEPCDWDTSDRGRIFVVSSINALKALGHLSAAERAPFHEDIRRLVSSISKLLERQVCHPSFRTPYWQFKFLWTEELIPFTDLCGVELGCLLRVAIALRRSDSGYPNLLQLDKLLANLPRNEETEKVTLNRLQIPDMSWDRYNSPPPDLGSRWRRAVSRILSDSRLRSSSPMGSP